MKTIFATDLNKTTTDILFDRVCCCDSDRKLLIMILERIDSNFTPPWKSEPLSIEHYWKTNLLDFETIYDFYGLLKDIEKNRLKMEMTMTLEPSFEMLCEIRQLKSYTNTSGGPACGGLQP